MCRPTPLERAALRYWLLARLYRANRWGLIATSKLGELLQDPHPPIQIRAADLWYRTNTSPS